MRVLVVIFGEVRTLSSCILSIYERVLIPNRPCQVVLAIDGKYTDIPSSVLQLLSPFLLDIYTTHNREDVPRHNQIIEFVLVQKALERVNVEDFKFILKIRTDLFVKSPIVVKTLYGWSSFEQFQKSFVNLCSKAKMDWREDVVRAMQSYLLCGGMDFFIPRQLDSKNPPRSPWSIKNVYEWNADLFRKMERIVLGLRQKDEGWQPRMEWIHRFLRVFCEENHVMFLIGSTWIHFGYAQDVAEVSRLMVEKHTTMKYPDVEDEEELTWVDHKNERRSRKQKDWMKITDDQIRMAHHLHSYPLVDLVNPADYIESFDAVHSLQVDKRRNDLFAWIVRSQQIKK